MSYRATDSDSESDDEREWSVRRIKAYGFASAGDARKRYRVEWDPSDGKVWDDTWEPASVFTDLDFLRDFRRRWDSRLLAGLRARTSGYKWYRVSWRDPAGVDDWQDTWMPREELEVLYLPQLAAFDFEWDRRQSGVLVPVPPSSLNVRKAAAETSLSVHKKAALPQSTNVHAPSNTIKRKRTASDDEGHGHSARSRRVASPEPLVWPVDELNESFSDSVSYSVSRGPERHVEIRGPSLGERAAAVIRRLQEACRKPDDWELMHLFSLALLYPVHSYTHHTASASTSVYERLSSLSAILDAARNNPAGPFDAIQAAFLSAARYSHKPNRTDVKLAIQEALSAPAGPEPTEPAEAAPIAWAGFRDAWLTLRARGAKVPESEDCTSSDVLFPLGKSVVEGDGVKHQATVIYGVSVYPTTSSFGKSPALTVAILPPIVQARGNRLLRLVGPAAVLQVYVDATPAGQSNTTTPALTDRDEQEYKISTIKLRLAELEVAGGVYEYLHFKVVHGDRKAKSLRSAATDYGIFLLSTHPARSPHLPPLSQPWHILANHMPAIPGNLSQASTKFLSRLDLFLSATHAVTLPPDTTIIHDLPDVHPTGIPDEAMTDGAGLVGRRTMQYVCTALGKTDMLPNTIQIRYRGFKGLLVLDRVGELELLGRQRVKELNGKMPDIAFRKSMCKYVSTPEELAIPGTLEIVSVGCMLNQQLVNVLEHGGVREDILRTLVAKATDALFETFLSPNKVLSAIQGLLSNPSSGGSSSSVRLAHNLCAGFDSSEPYMRKMLVEHVRWKLSRLYSQARIPVEESIVVTIVPAPKGTLKEGEIMVQIPGFSNALAGKEVVVMKNPAMLATDGQKLTVADLRDYPQLAGYDDVCMMSVEGDVREASRIAGGDYDGDKVMVIWHKPIVDAFHSSRTVPKVPAEVEEAFTRTKDTVAQVTQRNAGERYGRPLLARGLQEWSKASSSKTGWYSLLWAAAVDKWGMESPNAVRYAHIATRLLDARKNGETLDPEIDKIHRQSYLQQLGGQPPAWWKADGITVRKPVQRVPKFARFLHELTSSSDKVLEDKVATLEEAKPQPEICEYFSNDDRLFTGDRVWAHDMKLLKDALFGEELPLWTSYWKEGLVQKGLPALPSNQAPTAEDNPELISKRNALLALPGRDAVLAQFRNFFESKPAESDLQSPALRGTDGRQRLLKLKAALAYKHTKSKFVWDVCAHELRSIVSAATAGLEMHVAASFVPYMRFRSAPTGAVSVAGGDSAGAAALEQEAELDLSGIDWAIDDMDV
ncbi:hypothetical protein HDU93_000159 [Gonapodya sp. JEL0774]|nr:hypothetical protein HDU93_000159 [Gonapodya sp. JEL0774]